ncbi:MAG: sigma-70 family RNA polymerase sigma factor [Marinoscillum sp.]
MSHSSVCEEQVFQEVHKSHGQSLRNFLFYKFGDLEKARDFAQDAFIKLWHNCSKVPFEKAKSYLFTVANRLFLDEVDHQKVVLKFQHRQNLTESQMESNPEYVYREEEFKNRLEEIISELPEKQRTVFLLSRIDKMKNKEIAESLDLSIKTVEKHMTNSLKFLKDNLDEIANVKI